MITYDSNSPGDVFRIEGSNIPRSMIYALPSALMAIGFHYLMKWFSTAWPEGDDWVKHLGLSQVWAASTAVLVVLLGMRTNKAYGRFWEGITLVQLVRAEWFEAASNLIAFSLIAAKKDPDNTVMVNEVTEFQFTLVRLMSLMHGAALRQIGGNEEEFQVLDIQAIDGRSLGYLAQCHQNGVNPVEVLLQWVQVLVTDGQHAGTIAVPPPILTRVYQTLSRGMVNLHDARKLAEVPFPFPLTQMVFVLLFVQAIVTPMFFAMALESPAVAAFMTFVPIFGMFSITFTAGELEHPFGDDTNDLPLSRLQEDYNKSLLMLLDKETSRAPSVDKNSIRTVGELRRKYNNSRISSLTNSLAKDGSLARALSTEYQADGITPANSTCSDSMSYPFGRKTSGEFSSDLSGGSPQPDKPENESTFETEPETIEKTFDSPERRLDQIVEPATESAMDGDAAQETGLQIEQDMVQSLGALTQAILKLLHHFTWKGRPQKTVTGANGAVYDSLLEHTPGSIVEPESPATEDTWNSPFRREDVRNSCVKDTRNTFVKPRVDYAKRYVHLGEDAKRYVHLGEDTLTNNGGFDSAPCQPVCIPPVRHDHAVNASPPADNLHHTTPRIPSPPPSPAPTLPSLTAGDDANQLFVF